MMPHKFEIHRCRRGRKEHTVFQFLFIILFHFHEHSTLACYRSENRSSEMMSNIYNLKLLNGGWLRAYTVLVEGIRLTVPVLGADNCR